MNALVLSLLIGVPFDEPPAVTLEPLATVAPEDEALPFTDVDGYRYTVAGECFDPLDAQSRRVLHLAGYVPLVVWDEGLVALPENDGPAHVFGCERDGDLVGETPRFSAGEALELPPWQGAPFALGRRVCGVWDRDFFTGDGPTYELACFASRDDFAYHTSGAPLFAGETLLALDALDAHLGIAPLAPNADGSPAVVSTGTSFADAVEQWFATTDNLALPDGRVLLTLVRRSLATNGAAAGIYQSTRWLFLIEPNAVGIDDLVTLNQPEWPLRKLWPGGIDPDLELGKPWLDPSTNLVAWQVNGLEFGNRRIDGDTPRGVFGAQSIGFMLVDLAAAEPELHYASATDAYHGVVVQYDIPFQGTYDEGATLIDAGSSLAWRFGSAYTPTHTHGIVFHREHIGVAPVEAPPVEVDVATHVTTSALIARRFAGLVPEPWRSAGQDGAMIRSHAVDGPLCVVDNVVVCYDAFVNPVAVVPSELGQRALAADGHSLVTLNGAQLTSIDIYALTRSEQTITLPELDTGASLRIFPLDAHTVFLVRSGLDPAVWIINDDSQTLAFELDAAAVAAGFTTVPSGLVETMGLLATHFEVLGFLPSGELAIAVQGNWRRYVIAIAADGATRELYRTSNEGFGDIPRSSESAHGLWLEGGVFLDASGHFGTVTGLQLYSGDGFIQRPVPAFGTLLVENRDANDLVQPQQAGLHELVTFGPELEPGETLVFMSHWLAADLYLGLDRWLREVHGQPGMLFRVGLRGGMVSAWSIEPATYDYSFGEVTGMDLDRSGHLCMADHGRGELRVYGPPQSGHAPSILREKTPVPGIRDCRWRADGSLSVMVQTERSQVLTRVGGAFVADPADAGAPTARAFVKGPGVDLELVPSGEAAWVGGPETNLARVTYDRATMKLTSPWGELTLPNADPQHTPSIVLRPDGRAVLLPAIEYEPGRADPLTIVDPSRPDAPTIYVTLGDRGNGVAAAAVPWDRFSDPWTGAALDAKDPFRPPDGPEDFVNPTAPGNGRLVGPIDQSGDGGCGVGGPASWLLALLFVAACGSKSVPVAPEKTAEPKEDADRVVLEDEELEMVRLPGFGVGLPLWPEVRTGPAGREVQVQRTAPDHHGFVLIRYTPAAPDSSDEELVQTTRTAFGASSGMTLGPTTPVMVGGHAGYQVEIAGKAGGVLTMWRCREHQRFYLMIVVDRLDLVRPIRESVSCHSSEAPALGDDAFPRYDAPAAMQLQAQEDRGLRLYTSAGFEDLAIRAGVAMRDLSDAGMERRVGTIFGSAFGAMNVQSDIERSTMQGTDGRTRFLASAQYMEGMLLKDATIVVWGCPRLGMAFLAIHSGLPGPNARARAREHLARLTCP